MRPYHFIATGWRNLIRQKAANLLNIMGLGVGLAGCLVIFLIEQHEWSYNREQHNYNRIYQLVKNTKTTKGDNFHISIPFEAVNALRQDYPQITWAQLFADDKSEVTVIKNATGTRTDTYTELNSFFFAEPQLFDIFNGTWISGGPGVLGQPNTVVLCRSLAEKYFGTVQSAIGQQIRLDKAITVRVSGIIADPPATSDLPFRALVSYQTFVANSGLWGLRNLHGWGWSITAHQVFALLPEKTDAASIDRSLPAFIKKYTTDDKTSKKLYFLHPLSEVHFDTRFENNGDHISSKASLYTLGFVGVLILLMACINFVNLSTALAASRSREAGIRKVMGSNSWQLGVQVLTDTALVMSVSLVLALLLAQLALPYVKYISPIETTLTLLNKGTVLFIAATLVVTTLLSGIYPAIQFGRLNPIASLQNRLSARQAGGLSLRRILVVMQFSFSQLLIIATLIAVSQMNYIHNADMGFDKESVLILEGSRDSAFNARLVVFKQLLLAKNDIKAVSYSWTTPTDGRNEGNFYFDHSEAGQPFYAALKVADEDYAKAYGLQMVAGRWYTPRDTLGEAVVNETMAHRLGMHNSLQMLGKQIRIGNGDWRTIVGVVKDFKNSSLKEEVPANIIVQNRGNYGVAAVRLDTRNPGKTGREIEEIWNSLYPDYPFNASFMDDRIDRFYRQEQRLSASYKVYTLLAILISGLGLYGLVNFMAIRRTKEVGIRKVLGASVGHIVYMFSREFTVLIVIAFLISAPVAYYMMSNWLQGFVYRVHIGIGVFLATVSIAVAFAWITVGYRALRAALADPVRSLRTE
jgi:ABC-type antimicrobial peptide transport system permease subunit